MNQNEYKNICNQPNVFSRHLLEVTLRILKTEENHSIASRLTEALKETPISKPQKHKGDSFTDYF